MSTATETPSAENIDLEATAEAFQRVRTEVGKVVIGQQNVVEQILTALLGGGHCLLIGVPGLAKTVMAKSVAEALDMQFNRVQFTPDLMPSDITGTNVLETDEATGQKMFRFLPGPVFSNILLADEINRTPPKTQASLLEAMQERSITQSGESRPLPEPFFVLATQNPLEQEGTYPLPEAQLDRFMFSVVLTYTSHAEENQIVASTTQPGRKKIEPILSAEQIVAMQKLVRKAEAPPNVVRYAAALARATRPEDETAPQPVRQYLDCGAGPRAGQYLVLAAKARAVMMGRSEPTIDDVRANAGPVLRHRMFTNFTALSEEVTTDALIDGLIEQVPEPGETGPIAYNPPEVRPGQRVELPDGSDAVELIRSMRDATDRIRAQLQQVIIGQHEVMELMLTSLIAGGHCLLVGVPGLAKTMMVRTLADVLDLGFNRIQFTPDLMPSDITGTDVMETDESTGQRHFRFMPGPIFTNVLLADEINRTPPKTQAALLEAMQEHAVTAGGTTYPLDPPFFTLATQNPLEQEGTYPLPEAQLDRFMFNVRLDYPTAEEEPIIIDRTTGAKGGSVEKIISGRDIVRLQKVMRRVPISNHVLTYVTTLVRATRPETEGSAQMIRQYVHCGAGPRAAQYLVLGAKARAVMNGRVNVSVNDVRAVAVPVLRHRIFTNFLADAEGVSPMSIVQELIQRVPEPKTKDEKKLEADAADRTRANQRAAESGRQAPAEPQPQPQPAEPSEPTPEAKPRTGASSTAAEQSDDPQRTVTVHCPHCEHPAEVPAAYVGRKGKCWNCERVYQIPEPS